MTISRKKHPCPETYRMETDLPGLLNLLAEHLYSDVDVFVRELLQNAHDAIVMLRRCDSEIGGRIEIHLDRASGTISVSDNGIGMDRDDIRRFLSVIGSSSKRGTAGLEDLRKLAGEDLIGQFGIGMLSAFVVASSVEVLTCKSGSNGCRWVNNGSSDCYLETWQSTTSGTTVIMKIREDYEFVMEEEYLHAAIVQYGNFLPFPVYLNSRGPINAMNPPWLNSSDMDEQACADFIRNGYGITPLELIPVTIEGSCRARGILYITDERTPDFGTKGTVDLYVRRMFVSRNEPLLLPPWAKFIRGVIDSPDLKPTAARDGIKSDDPAVIQLRRQIGDLIIERLRTLAEHQPQRFSRLADWHHYHLKGMACLHEDFFNRIAESLPFDTNRGSMTLGSCLAGSAPLNADDGSVMIRYHTGKGASAQFERIAEEHGWLLIDAGKGFDAELLQRFASRNSARVTLIRVDVGDPLDLFKSLDPDQELRFKTLEAAIADRMKQAGIGELVVRTRSFSPKDIPALIMRNQQDETMDELVSSIGAPGLIDAAAEIGAGIIKNRKKRVLTLTINAHNPLVAQLANLQHYQKIEEEVSGPEANLVPTLLGVIFSTALMSSGVPTGKDDADLLRMQIAILGSGVLNLLDEFRFEKTFVRHFMAKSGEEPGEGQSPFAQGCFNC